MHRGYQTICKKKKKKKKKKQLETLIRIIRIYSLDIGMEFGIEIFAMLITKSGKKKKKRILERIELTS